MPGYKITKPWESTEESRAALAGYGGREPTAYEKAILLGLQSKPVYQGTVDPVEVAHRRRRNKEARKSRRINRRSR